MGARECAGGRTWLRDIDPSVPLVVLCGETPDGKGHLAAVEEHFDYAVADPGRILLRRAGWKSLEEAGEASDFFSICQLFLEEPRFYAQPDTQLHTQRMTQRNDPMDAELSKAMDGYDRIIHQAVQAYGEFLPFFQRLILQDLMPRLLTARTCQQMGVEEESLRQLLGRFDDDMIAGCGIPEDIRIRVLSFKYQTDIRDKLVYRSGKLKFDNLLVVPLKEIPFRVDRLTCEDGICRLGGTVMLPLENDVLEYYYVDNQGRSYEIEWEEGEELYFLGERMRTRKRFTAQLNVGNKPVGMRFMYRYKGAFHARIQMTFSDEIGIKEDTSRNTAVLGRYYMKMEKRILFVSPLQWKTKIKLFFTFSRKSIKMKQEKKGRKRGTL